MGGGEVLHGGIPGVGIPRGCVSRVPRARLWSMGKLFSFIGATLGGYAGWAIGSSVGFTTAFMVSVVGTGIGMYYGRRIAATYLP